MAAARGSSVRSETPKRKREESVEVNGEEALPLPRNCVAVSGLPPYPYLPSCVPILYTDWVPREALNGGGLGKGIQPRILHRVWCSSSDCKISRWREIGGKLVPNMFWMISSSALLDWLREIERRQETRDNLSNHQAFVVELAAGNHGSGGGRISSRSLL